MDSPTRQLFEDDPYRRECEARIVSAAPDGIVLDQTVFYPRGGGQPGDTGRLELAGGRSVSVVDTFRKPDSGEVVHVPTGDSVFPETGQVVRAVLNWERRHRLMRMHSCLHLLCAVVSAPVTGGQIHDGRGRLDFDLQDNLDRDEVTRQLNALIARDVPRSFRWITDDELDAQPDLVKTMAVQPPRGMGQVRLVEFQGVDLQPCGGTHVRSTGEIGPVLVAKVEKKGRHNRRVTVVFDDENNEMELS